MAHLPGLLGQGDMPTTGNESIICTGVWLRSGAYFGRVQWQNTNWPTGGGWRLISIDNEFRSIGILQKGYLNVEGYPTGDLNWTFRSSVNSSCNWAHLAPQSKKIEPLQATLSLKYQYEKTVTNALTVRDKICCFNTTISGLEPQRVLIFYDIALWETILPLNWITKTSLYWKVARRDGLLCLGQKTGTGIATSAAHHQRDVKTKKSMTVESKRVSYGTYGQQASLLLCPLRLYFRLRSSKIPFLTN